MCILMGRHWGPTEAAQAFSTGSLIGDLVSTLYLAPGLTGAIALIDGGSSYFICTTWMILSFIKIALGTAQVTLYEKSLRKGLVIMQTKTGSCELGQGLWEIEGETSLELGDQPDRGYEVEGENRMTSGSCALATTGTGRYRLGKGQAHEHAHLDVSREIESKSLEKEIQRGLELR